MKKLVSGALVLMALSLTIPSQTMANQEMTKGLEQAYQKVNPLQIQRPASHAPGTRRVAQASDSACNEPEKDQCMLNNTICRGSVEQVYQSLFSGVIDQKTLDASLSQALSDCDEIEDECLADHGCR